MKQVVKIFLNISTVSFLSFNIANADTNNEEQIHILNSSVENISQNQTESNRQILELQNKLENLMRKFETINSQNEAPKLPAGTVVAFAGKNIPKGWLLCDGRVISRKGVYQALFDSIGSAHGQGDGSTTFHLPDYRGLFLRGVLDERSSLIDPSAATRGAMNTGGNTGNKVGTYQSDSFAEHSHNSGNLKNSSNYLSYSGSASPDSRVISGSTNYEGSHSHDFISRWGAGNIGGGGYNVIQADRSLNRFITPTETSGSHSHSFSVRLPNYSFSINTNIPAQTISGTTATQGGSETRPKNAYVYYIIKY